MSAQHIHDHFRYLREMADKLAGAELREPERKAVQGLADSALQLLESVALDINRIANALERIDRI